MNNIMSNMRQELKSGQKVCLDKDFQNSSIVTIVRQSPQKLYSTVKNIKGNEWDVMTNRLTKID